MVDITKLTFRDLGKRVQTTFLGVRKYGSIVAFNKKSIFVQFDGEEGSRCCSPVDLKFVVLIETKIIEGRI